MIDHMFGTIINISRFCTEDGPGIRTAVFLKGCPLSCAWCHNPESQNGNPELMYDQKKCIGCRQCTAACAKGCHSFPENAHVFSRQNCIACGKCVRVCPTGALELTGKTIFAEAVVQTAEKDLVFYQTSRGGVTISGGEPLYQPDFTAEILRRCREKNIHTAIETSGFAGEETVRSVVRHCDLVLFDIKETDEENHKRFTGVPLAPVLQSLQIIDKMQIPFILRLPIVPGINDREEHFQNVKKLADTLSGCIKIEIMPYHMLGEYKYCQLQRPYLCSGIIEPSPETAGKWREAVR